MTNEEAIEYWEQFNAEIDDLYDACSDADRDVLVKQREIVEYTISALRKQEAVTDSHQMTNADRIRAISYEELAEFLSSIAYGRETPWSEPFARRLCDSCPTVHGTYESGIEDDFHECDFVDGKCPHGSDIVWWLQQPAEEDDHA